MKKLLPAFMLAGGLLLLTACAGTVNESNTAPAAPPGDTVVVATPPPATQPNLSTSVVPDEQPPAESDTNFTSAMPEDGSSERTPLDSSHPMWVIQGEGADLTVDSTGAIWNGDMQITFPRDDDVFVPDPPSVTNEPIQEPTWTAPSGNFHASLMNVGRYPAEWAERNVSITPLSFHEAMVANNPNLRSMDSVAGLTSLDFVAMPGTGVLRSMAWNNGVVTVLLQRLQNPEPGVWGRMSVTAWFTDERDPETGAISDSRIEIFHSDDMNAVWSLHAGGSEFGVEFARQLWDALALLDQAASYADIEAARRMFE